MSRPTPRRKIVAWGFQTHSVSGAGATYQPPLRRKYRSFSGILSEKFRSRDPKDDGRLPRGRNALAAGPAGKQQFDNRLTKADNLNNNLSACLVQRFSAAHGHHTALCVLQRQAYQSGDVVSEAAESISSLIGRDYKSTYYYNDANSKR